MTKTQMTQVIIQALWNLDNLPAPDDSRVLRYRRVRKDEIQHLHGLAVAALEARVAKEDSQ